MDIEVLQKLRSFCAYRERAEFEVLQKAKDLDLNEAGREMALNQLKQEGFVNDERFAKVFVRSKFRQNKWGKYKIRAALMEKRVNSGIADLALTELDLTDYENTAADLIDALSAKGKGAEQIFQSMKGKGYEGELLYSLMQKKNLV